MTDILDLKNWQVTEKLLDQDGYLINAEYTIKPTACIKCGTVGNLYRHGTKPVIYRDSPIRGHHTHLKADVQRYRCRECGETFLQPLDGVETERRMTTRCVEYIQSLCLQHTFVRLSDLMGCDEKTVRNIAGDYIQKLDAAYKPYLPEWIGIDENNVAGGLRCLITDVGNRVPIDLLETRDGVAVAGWFYQFKDRSHVRGIAMDMWRGYKSVANSLFPGIPVVIDKFHVVKMANLGLERARIRVAKDRKKAIGTDWKRNKLLLTMRYKDLGVKQRFNVDMWLDNEPDIAAAYWLKETFFDIYNAPDHAAAEAALDAWRASVPANMKSDFKALLTATANWRNPKQSEVTFGHGAIHYADVNLSEFIKPNGRLKKWAKIDGLRYNRY